MRKHSFGCAALACCLAVPAAAAAAQESSDALESTRATLAKWFETQQIISKERRDWQLGTEVLEQRIGMLDNEIAGLDGRIAEARGSLGQVEAKTSEVAGGNRELQDASALLRERIGPLEQKARDLIRVLPAPILERIEPLVRRIPRDPASTSLTLGERFQNVIGTLNEIDKFNREITVANELRALPGGRTLEVRSLYIGLGQGYYVTPDGLSAGVGVATADGWSWQPADGLAGDIARAIAILQNEQPPAYVPLEVTLR